MDKENITPREKKYALKEPPSLLNYCAYIFNLQSSVIGPSFEYKDWDDFINLRGHYADMPLFSNYPKAFERFTCAISSTVFGLVLSLFGFDAWNMLKPEFATYSFAYQVFYLLGSVHGCIWIYVSGLVLGEASLVAAGFGY